jgi:hypothetical protein
MALFDSGGLLFDAGGLDLAYWDLNISKKTGDFCELA